MPDNSKTFEEKSRLHWTSTTVPDAEQVKVGSLQRIAAATELMAQNYQQMQRDLDYFKARTKRLEEDNKKLHRRLTAQRGATTRAKNQQGT